MSFHGRTWNFNKINICFSYISSNKWDIIYTIHKYLYTANKLFISGEILSATTQNLGICFFSTKNRNVRWRIIHSYFWLPIGSWHEDAESNNRITVVYSLKGLKVFLGGPIGYFSTIPWREQNYIRWDDNYVHLC